MLLKGTPLTNFYEHKFSFEGVEWITREAAFQAGKAVIVKDMQAYKALQNMTGAQARQAGRNIAMTKQELDAWNSVKKNRMYQIAKAAFEQVAEYKQAIMNTPSEQLIETSPWDNFWGSKTGVETPYNNQYGKIMRRLQEETKMENTIINEENTAEEKEYKLPSEMTVEELEAEKAKVEAEIAHYNSADADDDDMVAEMSLEAQQELNYIEKLTEEKKGEIDMKNTNTMINENNNKGEIEMKVNGKKVVFMTSAETAAKLGISNIAVDIYSSIFAPLPEHNFAEAESDKDIDTLIKKYFSKVLNPIVENGDINKIDTTKVYVGRNVPAWFGYKNDEVYPVGVNTWDLRSVIEALAFEDDDYDFAFEELDESNPEHVTYVKALAGVIEETVEEPAAKTEEVTPEIEEEPIPEEEPVATEKKVEEKVEEPAPKAEEKPAAPAEKEKKETKYFYGKAKIKNEEGKFVPMFSNFTYAVVEAVSVKQAQIFAMLYAQQVLGNAAGGRIFFSEQDNPTTITAEKVNTFMSKGMPVIVDSGKKTTDGKTVVMLKKQAADNKSEEKVADVKKSAPKVEETVNKEPAPKAKAPAPVKKEQPAPTSAVNSATSVAPSTKKDKISILVNDQFTKSEAAAAVGLILQQATAHEAKSVYVAVRSSIVTDIQFAEAVKAGKTLFTFAGINTEIYNLRDAESAPKMEGAKNVKITVASKSSAATMAVTKEWAEERVTYILVKENGVATLKANGTPVPKSPAPKKAAPAPKKETQPADEKKTAPAPQEQVSELVNEKTIAPIASPNAQITQDALKFQRMFLSYMSYEMGKNIVNSTINGVSVINVVTVNIGSVEGVLDAMNIITTNGKNIVTDITFAGEGKLAFTANHKTTIIDMTVNSENGKDLIVK